MSKVIAVLGAGHGGHAVSAELTEKGYDVRLYQDPLLINTISKVYETREIKISGELRKTAVVKISTVTTDLKQAVKGADIIFVTVPAFVHRKFASEIAEFIEGGQIIVLLPGTLGSLVFARIFKEKGVLDKVLIAEANTLPYDTRVLAPGECFVYKMNEPLLLGVFPAIKTDEVFKKLEGTYNFTPVTDVLECALHSHNPILHTPGCIMNTGRIERSWGDFYLYEEGFTPTICRVTEEMDKERMAIGYAYGYKPLTLVQAISGLKNPGDLWKEVNGNKGLCFIKGPESIKSRYFTEDTPNGLVPWSMIAGLAGVKTPLIDSFATISSVVIEFDSWKDGRTLKDMGINGLTKEQLKEYMKIGKRS